MLFRSDLPPVCGDRSGIVFYTNPLRAQAVLDGFLGEFGQTFTTLSVLHLYDILAALPLGIPPSLIFLLLPVPLLPRGLGDLGVNPLHAGPAGTVRLRGRAESTAVYLVS